MVDFSGPRSLLDRVLARFFRRRFALAALATTAAGVTLGCATAANTRAKLDDAVQETNVAARFGRGDIAVERVAATARPAFLKRHKGWGRDLRIVDVEFGSVEKMGATEAVVLVSFEWQGKSDGLLRSTVVRETWKTDGSDTGWWLVDEERASGDIGLLGDAVAPKAEEAAKAPALPRYETTTIPGD
jgi:hypothetical protein